LRPVGLGTTRAPATSSPAPRTRPSPAPSATSPTPHTASCWQRWNWCN